MVEQTTRIAFPTQSKANLAMCWSTNLTTCSTLTNRLLLCLTEFRVDPRRKIYWRIALRLLYCQLRCYCCMMKFAVDSDGPSPYLQLYWVLFLYQLCQEVVRAECHRPTCSRWRCLWLLPLFDFRSHNFPPVLSKYCRNVLPFRLFSAFLRKTHSDQRYFCRTNETYLHHLPELEGIEIVDVIMRKFLC